MKNLEELINLLTIIKSDYLVHEDQVLSLKINNSSLLKITANKMSVIDVFDLTGFIENSRNQNNEGNLKHFKDFYSSYSNRIIRLNHLGIQIYSEDFASIINQLKDQVKGSNFDLYEEESDDKGVKWLFMGNADNYETPLFEIVLTSYKSDIPNKWTPHFQIDLDTDLSVNELEKITDQYFGEKFFDWKLDIPDYGVVLAMGWLGCIEGVNVQLGLGTNLRNTKYHRENVLKKLS